MFTIKRKNPEKFNIKNVRPPSFGTLLFMIVFIYILIRIIAFVRDDTPVVFTVEQSTYDTDFTAVGIAIRKETLITAPTGGTACYYIGDGEKVSKGSDIFAVDSTGALGQAVDNMLTDGSLLSSDDYTEISSQIKMFKTGFTPSGFGDVYNFKTSMDNKLLELYEDTVLEAAGSKNVSLTAQTAPFSGLVAYYEDGCENITVNDLSADLFDKTTYTKKSLKSDSGVEAGSPVCKLIDDEEWQIAISLTEEEYRKVTQNEYAVYTINDSSRRIKTLYDKIEKDGCYYIVVSFNKYMAQYIDERFLDINFQFDESSGLKVPASAIVTKEAYMIPIDCLSKGNGDDDEHLNQITGADGGDTKVKQITPVIYFSDDRFCYVNPADIDSDAVLLIEDSDKTFSVATAARYTMQGVMCVSKGTAEFRRTEMIVEGDDYCIVKQGSSYGISRYDRILLDGSSLAEGDTVY